MSYETDVLDLVKEHGFAITVDDEDGFCIEINTRQTRLNILGDHFICFDQDSCLDAIKDDSRDYATPDELWEFIAGVLDHGVSECDRDCDECESW